jgi:hypothetical protein
MNNNNHTIRKQTYSSTTVFIVIGILVLVGICIYLYNTYKTFKAKLLATDVTLAYTSCPDYWDSLGNGKCQNSNSLGSCSTTAGANIMDFSSEIFTNKNTGNYAKCKWAKACNIAWSNVDRLC